MMKIIACVGFMILGIIINVGGVPTDDRGYIGVTYWYEERSLYQRLANILSSGNLHTTPSSMASTVSALSSSRLHSLSEALNLQV